MVSQPNHWPAHMKGRRVVATSQVHPGKNGSHEREHNGAKRERGRNGAANETAQLIFTLNTTTGAVTKIEKIDEAGKRREVQKERNAETRRQRQFP